MPDADPVTTIVFIAAPYRGRMTDPEDSVDHAAADLEETEVDLADEFDRPAPLEAEPADVAEQMQVVARDDDDDYRE
jgi:hypothetical protein